MSILTSESPSKSYERFLYAPVCEQRNGTQLSVLSALVRVSVDPWTEAARLAAMPRAKAAETLRATLDRVCEEDLTPPETEAAATRLIGLLHCDGAEGAGASAAAKPDAERRVFLFLWLGFVMGMMIFSSDNRARTTGAGVSAPASEPTPPSRSGAVPQPKTD